MPRISVVVPVFDVESYLATCLQSLARQTVTDLEVIVVDDGSTDGSRAIAECFAVHDERFRLVAQANGGLGSARNRGLEAATGEYLAFVDSDDVMPADAYERLLGALTRTRSDFATGNVQRLTRQGTSQAQFLARTFARTRLGTHVSRCRPLLADRTAWNKLFRRSFWDEHDLRFPEGVVHEDIPVMLPAHQLARSVDVIAAPVYQWRVREDGAPSITQRRREPRVLRDRLAAIASVRAHLARHAAGRLARWYDASIVADDLRLHLDVLDEACEEYRAVFMAEVPPMLERVPRRVFDRLPAIDRLKWHLVRSGRLDDAIDVVRFHKREAAVTPVLRARGRFYGDYPHRSDSRIPGETFKLGRRDDDLALTARLEQVRHEDGKLRVRGHAFINGLGCSSGADQRTRLVALRPGRLRAVRLRVAALKIPTAPATRADLGAARAWAGFEASLDPRVLPGGEGTWELFATTRVGLLRRRRARFALESAALLGAVDLTADGGTLARAVVTSDGALRVEVRTRFARLRSRGVRDGDLELVGDLRGTTGPRVLVARRRSDGMRLHVSAAQRVDGAGAFRACLPLAHLVRAGASLEAAAAGGAGAPEMWELSVAGLPVSLPDELGGVSWRAGDHEVELSRSRAGNAALVTRGMPARLEPRTAAQPAEGTPAPPAAVRAGSHSDRT